MKPITVLIKYDNEFGEQEERYAGFLTGNLHAMYDENDYGRIVFVKVVPTDEPNVYLSVSGYCSLGYLDESDDPKIIIEKLTNKLHNMTAFEFMTDVIIHVKAEIEFEDTIIPNLIL